MFRNKGVIESIAALENVTKAYLPMNGGSECEHPSEKLAENSSLSSLVEQWPEVDIGPGNRI